MVRRSVLVVAAVGVVVAAGLAAWWLRAPTVAAVTLPALMREGRVTAAQREHALAVLASVGLQDAIDKRHGELSGDMQLRVAIARALVLEPLLALADEPTSNLDTQSANEVFNVMRRMHAALKVSFLFVTHDPRLAARGDRVIELTDRRIERDEAVAAATHPEPADASAP